MMATAREWVTKLYAAEPHAIMPAPLSTVEHDIRACTEHLRHDGNGEIAAAVLASDKSVELIWARECYLDLLADLLIEVIERSSVKFLAINRSRYPIRVRHLGFRLRCRYFRLLYKAIVSHF